MVIYSRLIAQKLKELNLTIATAESVTAGLLASSLTIESGASNYFKGGIVVYNNQAKINLLNVKDSTISNFGAVSRFCAREMALGVMRKFNVDIALACSGIAGPLSVENKPVGLLFFCIIIGNKAYDFEINIDENDRELNRQLFAQKILQTLYHLLKEITR